MGTEMDGRIAVLRGKAMRVGRFVASLACVGMLVVGLGVCAGCAAGETEEAEGPAASDAIASGEDGQDAQQSASPDSMEQETPDGESSGGEELSDEAGEGHEASSSEREQDWFARTGFFLPDGLVPVENGTIDTPYYTIALPASWADAEYVYHDSYSTSGATADGDELGLGYETTVVSFERGEQFSVCCFSVAWGPQGGFASREIGPSSVGEGLNVYVYAASPQGDATDSAVIQARERVGEYASWVTVK